MIGSGDGPLVEFAFVSVAIPGFPEAALLRLAQQMTTLNLRRGITGEMRFGDGRFTQVIEGSSQAVLPLAARILTDRRHDQIAVMNFRPIPARRFRDWSCPGLSAAASPLAAGAVATANLCLMPLIAAFVGGGKTAAMREASLAP